MRPASGTPVAGNRSCQTAEPRGPVQMQDYQPVDKIALFSRGRIPERVVHALGGGAHRTLPASRKLTGHRRIRLLGQAGKLRRLMGADRKLQRTGDRVSAPGCVSPTNQDRQLAQSYRADPNFGAGVAAVPGIVLDALTGRAA